MNPTVFFFPVRKLRADASGVYPSSAIARYTFSLVSVETYRVLLMVWDTVAVETPASLATSLMVTFMTCSSCVIICIFCVII